MLKAYQTFTLDGCRNCPSILRGLQEWQTPFMLSPQDNMEEFSKLCNEHGFHLVTEGGMLIVEKSKQDAS